MAIELLIKNCASCCYDLYDVISARPTGYGWTDTEKLRVVLLTDAGVTNLISSLGLSDVAELINYLPQPVFDDIESEARVITSARRFKIDTDPTNEGEYIEIADTNMVDKEA